VAAIADGDAEQARAAMRDHLAAVEHDLRDRTARRASVRDLHARGAVRGAA
jgi:DNA-binding FadR family transcriptional regulator